MSAQHVRTFREKKNEVERGLAGWLAFSYRDRVIKMV